MFSYGNYTFPYYDGIYAYTQTDTKENEPFFPQLNKNNQNENNSKFENSENNNNNNNNNSYDQLSNEEKQKISELKSIDLKIRAHEMAHMAVGGDLAGSASFSFITGPDGLKYAVAGEVPIKIKSGNTPQETMQIAKQIKAAALAPADPSSQDRSVAASADKLYASAAIEAYKTAMKLPITSKSISHGKILSFYG